MNWRKIVFGEFNVKRLIRSVLFIYGTLVVLGFFFSEKIIFPYHGCSYAETLSGLSFLETEDGTRLATRYWKSDPDEYLVLYFHGNGEDLGHMELIANMLVWRGLSILAMDYRGYGLSTGTSTESSTYKDADLLYNTALAMGYTPEQIIIWGRSVGGGPAVDLALKKKACALMLDSPFISAFRVKTAVPLVPFDRFNNLSKISKVDEPLLIIHGAADKTVPCWHSKKLFNRHTGMKKRYVFPNAGHADLWSYDLNEVFNELDLFIGKKKK